jgi:hypothetical protein
MSESALDNQADFAELLVAENRRLRRALKRLVGNVDEYLEKLDQLERECDE